MNLFMLKLNMLAPKSAMEDFNILIIKRHVENYKSEN